MSQQHDFERLRSAYTVAYKARDSGHPSPTDVLTAELDSCEDDVFSGPGPGRDLIVELFERDVAPADLKRELGRAVPGLAVSAFASLARATGQIVGALRPGEPTGPPDASGVPEVIGLEHTVSLSDLTVAVYALEIWDGGFRLLGTLVPPTPDRAVGSELLAAIETDPPADGHTPTLAVDSWLDRQRVEWCVPLAARPTRISLGGRAVFEAD